MTLTSDALFNLSEPERERSPEEFSGAAVLAQWLSQADRIVQSSKGLPPESSVDEKRFLRFRLGGNETALLALDSIQEVLQIRKQAVLRVPEVAAPVLGVANCRGSILWLVDLGLLLGLNIAPSDRPDPPWHPLDPSEQVLNTITIQAAGQCLGLVVPQVIDLETQDTAQIQPPNADLFPLLLMPWLAGYVTPSCSPILSATALIEQLQMAR